MPCYVATATLAKQMHAASLLSLKAQILACIDEESLFGIVRDYGRRVLGFDSCHLFLNKTSAKSAAVRLDTHAELNVAEHIELRTRLEETQSGRSHTIGRGSQLAPGATRPPLYLHPPPPPLERVNSWQIDKSNKTTAAEGEKTRSKSPVRTGEKTWWAQGGEIKCHSRHVDNVLGQEFPTSETIECGLPIAAVKAGEHIVIKVHDSLDMGNIPASDPAWALSPRLAASLDGILAEKRMSTMAMSLRGGQGVVRVARYARSAPTCSTARFTASPPPALGTKKQLRCLTEDETTAVHLLVRALDETLPVVLEAQKYATLVFAHARSAHSKLTGLDDLRRHHNLMIQAFIEIKDAGSMTDLSQRVVRNCVSTIETLFQRYIPAAANAGGTVYTVKQHHPGGELPVQWKTSDFFDD